MAGGGIGVGPGAIQRDDIVCIFYGADVPFIIRPVPEKDYLLIGECVMFVGLIMQEGAAGSHQEGKETWITLI
ncbi:hypothetical protein B0T25DRAFT_362256 [Lasiosphaeria hispida]|uniref:Uncharacterized protein n=1 Tax=Lasiosphaeria hispida TaxID=260671 RepID=A0AAJ0M7N5_9PEZI|nr:hypothetical protein B0T25DRAFT_362256 [Lasiosphaeria hispida]